MIIDIQGKNAAEFSTRLLKWSIIDASGETADRVTLTIDTDGLELLPMSGDEYTFKVDGERRGKFQVTTLSETLVTAVLTVNLSPAKFARTDPTGWREPRKKTFKPATVGDVVRAVMIPHGYTVKIDPELTSRPTDHLNQNEETDKAFITRLAKKHDAIAKPVDGLFIFGKKGETKKLTGAPKRKVSISPQNLIKPSGSISYPAAMKYKGVKASWRESDTGANGEIIIGEEPFDFIKQPFKTEADAITNAEAKLKKHTRTGQVFSGSIEGEAGFFAEAVLTLDGFNNKRIVGDWSLDEVTLNGSRTTYKIQVKASRPTI